MTHAFHAHSNFPELCESLADRIAEDMTDSVGSRGGASLVVPGGSTPGELFDVLCRRALPWDRVSLTLTDERWVPLDSARSNERLVRDRLLTHLAQHASFVSLLTDASQARDAEQSVNARVTRMKRPFDIVVTGMGDDGHTASWIPGSQGLADALDMAGHLLVRAITPPAAVNLEARMTLTLRAILESYALVLLLRGRDKRKTYERALTGTDIFEMPIRALIHQTSVPLEVYWSAN